MNIDTLARSGGWRSAMDDGTPHHPFAGSVGMHLLPGVLATVVYRVWWKRNISLGMITHCLLNSIGLLFTLGLLLR